MRRLFFALCPNDTIRAQLVHAASKIECGEGRRIAAANLHVTLLFIGNVEDASAGRLQTAADRVLGDRFELHFDRLGRWRRSGIAWLAPAAIPSGLSDLVEQLHRHIHAAGFALETRAYRPHVTICRCLPNAPPPSGEVDIRWRVDEFALLESVIIPSTVRYEVIRRWPLAASGRAALGR